MAIGERIRTFRKRKGLTQKELGVQLGFKASTADIRTIQYEAEKRVSKDDLIKTLSSILEVFLRPLMFLTLILMWELCSFCSLIKIFMVYPSNRMEVMLPLI